MSKRNLRKNIFVLFFLILFGIGTGYAYINSSLYINGTSIINANVWNVGFDNLNVSTGSVAAISEPIVDSNVPSTSYSVKLANQDDFYEFTVDVVNSGEYDAKLGSLVETTGLTLEQEKYFNYSLNYQNGEPVQVNQLVKKDEFVRLKSRIEYKDEVSVSFVPESAKTLNLGFKLNYDLDDGTGINVIDNGVKITYRIISGDLDTVGSEIAIGNEYFYVISSDEDSATMLSKLNITAESIPKQTNEYIGVPFSKDHYWANDDQYAGYYVCELKDEYKADYPIYVYNSNSSQYVYIENYKTYLESRGVVVEEARLIKIEELEKLGCNISSYSCSNAPTWVYSLGNQTGYWTGSLMGCRALVKVNEIGEIQDFAFNYESSMNIRPVITIKKEENA